MPKEWTQIDIMQEILEEDMEALTELIAEEIKPLIKHRQDMEKKIGNKAIQKMYEMEKLA